MGQPALADNGIVFETSKPKIVWWRFYSFLNLSVLETINRPSRLSLLNGKNNGFTANDWQKNTHFHLFNWFCPVFTQDKQILSTAPLKIILSRTKFVKLQQIKPYAFVKHWWWQTICLNKHFFARADRPYDRYKGF